MTRSILIPFDGLYHSTSSSILDYAEEMLFQDDHGPVDQPEDFFMACDYAAIHDAYARFYTEQFQDWLENEIELKINFIFDKMESPREYNFTTDRIFATISDNDAETLRRYVKPVTLARQIKARCTSYSGFSSFYSNSLRTWLEKPFAEWDHNEMGILLEAAIYQSGVLIKTGWNSRDKVPTKRMKTLSEMIQDIMEDTNCNGEMDDLLYKNMGKEALAILNAWYKKHRAECA